MSRIGLPELLVILAIAPLIFGLPDLARSLRQAVRGFKQAMEEGERGDQPSDRDTPQ